MLNPNTSNLPTYEKQKKEAKATWLYICSSSTSNLCSFSFHFLWHSNKPKLIVCYSIFNYLIWRILSWKCALYRWVFFVFRMFAFVLCGHKWFVYEGLPYEEPKQQQRNANGCFVHFTECDPNNFQKIRFKWFITNRGHRISLSTSFFRWYE